MHGTFGRSFPFTISLLREAIVQWGTRQRGGPFGPMRFVLLWFRPFRPVVECQRFSFSNRHRCLYYPHFFYIPSSQCSRFTTVSWVTVSEGLRAIERLSPTSGSLTPDAQECITRHLLEVRGQRMDPSRSLRFASLCQRGRPRPAS